MPKNVTMWFMDDPLCSIALSLSVLNELCFIPFPVYVSPKEHCHRKKRPYFKLIVLRFSFVPPFIVETCLK